MSKSNSDTKVEPDLALKVVVDKKISPKNNKKRIHRPCHDIFNPQPVIQASPKRKAKEIKVNEFKFV